jgi:peptidoglycan/xylan/chitin deacetylase (PgdA/CDA1 family)
MARLVRTWRSVNRIARTRYPGFIFGLPLARGEIPVFTYHDVAAASFGRDLEFLRANGYRTLGLDEYLGLQSGKYRRASNAVLLTFDDARKSFYSDALPQLRLFDAHAVLFAPTYWMDAATRVPADHLFMSWQQLRDCVESGHVDVQSHAHRHALVPISAQLVDFANPLALQRFDIYDWPMRSGAGQSDELGRPAYGTPIYRAAPLLSAPTRYVENAALTLACQEYVERSGGAAFFSQHKWRTALLGEYRRLARDLIGMQMQETEFANLVASEFELSATEFRKHLGYAPHTIAYPWMLGSRLSLELAARHGFRTAFGVALDFGAQRRCDSPLAVYGRFKCDWLQFLPGEQRSSLFAAFTRKIRGFATTQHLAH